MENGFEKSRVKYNANSCLLAAGVFRNSLGPLRHGVFGQLSREQQAYCGLDFSARDGGAFVVVSQARCLGGDALKDVVDETVHDGHGLAGYASVGVYLFQYFVDVDGVGLLPGLLAGLLLVGGSGRGFLPSGFLCFL